MRDLMNKVDSLFEGVADLRDRKNAHDVVHAVRVALGPLLPKGMSIAKMFNDKQKTARRVRVYLDRKLSRGKRVNPSDAEKRQLEADLARALTQGGYTVKNVEYIDPNESGVYHYGRIDDKPSIKVWFEY